MSDDVAEVKAAITDAKPKAVIRSKDLLSTGSTLLNLACCGRVVGGYPKGHYIYFVGDTNSGKTWLVLVAFAEANINKNFEDYEFVLDNPEGGAKMDVAHYFGKGTADRIKQPPRGTSTTVEQFYYNLDDLFDAGRPFIYILDSMDTLVPEDDEKKYQKKRRAGIKKKGGEEEEGAATGSYGTAKAKLNSQNLRRVIPKLEKSGSILIIISQTRDNIGTFSFEKKTRAGGHALAFWATMSIWTSVKEKLKKNVRGKQRQTGILSRAQVKRTRITGRDRTVLVPIYHSSGVDDVGSCVRYLIEEKYWKGNETNVTAPEFDYSGPIEGLVQKIEQSDSERELKVLVAQTWDDIESKLTVKRKQRYE